MAVARSARSSLVRHAERNTHEALRLWRPAPCRATPLPLLPCAPTAFPPSVALDGSLTAGSLAGTLHRPRCCSGSRYLRGAPDPPAFCCTASASGSVRSRSHGLPFSIAPSNGGCIPPCSVRRSCMPCGGPPHCPAFPASQDIKLRIDLQRRFVRTGIFRSDPEFIDPEDVLVLLLQPPALVALLELLLLRASSVDHSHA